MKCLLLFPGNYSLVDTMSKGLAGNRIETVHVRYEDFFSPRVNRFVGRFESLPGKIRNVWKEPYVQKLNAGYKKAFDEHSPDLVFIYNNQLALPETVRYFREKSKVIFFLGDNPLYTPTSEYNLTVLFEADYIICPDSFWVAQLNAMGLSQCEFGVFGFNEDVFFPYSPLAADLEKYACDLVYVGTGQKTNWGYKRFLFLDQFKELNLKAYISGDGYYQKWAKYFPGLEKCIIPYQSFNPAFNNLVSNCAKVYPVDLVPSLFHGVHIRIMDCIGSGILPLVEYSVDLDTVFEGVRLPVIKKYEESVSLARYFINHDDERERLTKTLRQFAIEKYAPVKVIREILTKLD